MKKLCRMLLCVLMVLWNASALAEDFILPDPGYYFGRVFDGYMIEFEEYPEDEFEAYTTLLMEKYGMEITDSHESDVEKYYFMKNPDVSESKVFVSCIKETDGVYMMEFIFDKSITLSVMEVYDQQEGNTTAEITWDNGRMIADPGDFLGYEIECIEYLDKTDSITMGYFSYKYEAIATEDILVFAEAINASPCFERNNEGIKGKNYWLVCYDYTGDDAGLMEKCEEGRAELRRRKSDFSIYICDPYASKSEFYIYEYHGFTVNSSMNTEREDNDQVGDRCSFCDGDGRCNGCGGGSGVWGWEWVYVDGSPRQEQVNKSCEGIYCNGGACSKGGGVGGR